MILDDVVTVLVDDAPYAEVEAHVGYSKVDIVTPTWDGLPTYPMEYSRIYVELPMLDMGTGQRLGVSVPQVSGFYWRSQRWVTQGWPAVVRRRNGVDHHVVWTVLRSGSPGTPQ